MKMLNLLDMSGNQIQNFLVHNGDASSKNRLAAQTGRLVYDTTERSLFFGYDNAKTKQVEWARLVDTSHIGEIIGDYAVPIEREVVDAKIDYNDRYIGIEFLNSKGARLFDFVLMNANDSRAGLLTPEGYGAILSISNIKNEVDAHSRTLINSPSWDQAYNWGNHASVGYAKAFKIEKAVEASEHPFTGNTYEDVNALKTSTGRNDWTQKEVVFDTAANRLLCEYTITDGDSTISAYVKKWAGYNTILIAAAYEHEGYLVFVKGNSSIYKYENSAWVLLFSGASQDVIEKIDDIREALGLDTADGGVIDTWNEIKKFFAGVNDEQTLLGELSKKANDSDVIKKPTAAGNSGDFLMLNGTGASEWKSLKRVHTWTVSAGSDLTRYISVPDTNVSVKVYKQTFPDIIPSHNSTPMLHWSEVIADVDIVSMNDAFYVSITFGVREEGTYKAVII